MDIVFYSFDDLNAIVTRWKRIVKPHLVGKSTTYCDSLFEDFIKDTNQPYLSDNAARRFVAEIFGIEE